MKLSKEATLALAKIGAEIADRRPDIANKLSDRFLVESAIFALLGEFYDERPRDEVLAESFGIALITAHNENTSWRIE